MATSIGTRVRRRGSGELGVVVGTLGAELEVSFASGTHFVAPDDVEPVIDPLRQLQGGELDDPEAARLRLLAVLLDHSSRFDPGASLHNARLELQLHQVFVAHRVVAEKPAPRMILADEVGLGKTIEAGLIIKELRARKALQRVLVVAPASLTTQWRSELRTKFNEDFEIVDGTAAKHLGRAGANPFNAVDNVICSLPFATQKKRSEQLLEAPWDLVIFDEAHRVRRRGVGASTVSNTLAYKFAEEIRDQVDGLLLLSATPMQLEASELYNLIELVEPGLFVSFRAFQERRDQIPELNALMHSIERWPLLDTAARAQAEARHSRLLADLPAVDLRVLDDAEARDKAKDAIGRFHPLAYAMVRNRKRELGLAGERQATIIRVELSDAERELYEEVAEYIRNGYDAAKREKNLAVGFLMVTYQKMLTSSSNSLRVSLRRRIEKLRGHLSKGAPKATAAGTVDLDDPDELSAMAGELDDIAVAELDIRAEIAFLGDLVARLDDIRDAKLGKAVQLVGDLRRDWVSGDGPKVVIFTQFIETQSILAKTLEYAGHKVAIFNGRQSMDEKDGAVRIFRESADVLVSTEAGGEGRNLQFANILINYDLPWNPMKVEQRIGRLDRIGQTRIVEIYNLVAADTLEDRVVQILAERIRLFEQSVGSLDPILGEVEKEIERIAMGAEPAAAWDKFGADTERQVTEARLLEDEMSDFVLDRASFRQDSTNRLLGKQSLTEAAEVRRVVEAALDYVGGSVMEHSEGGETIALPTRVATQWGLPRQGHHGVFDPQTAVRRDDLPFFALGHPLIDRILEAVRALPASSVGARRCADVEPGVWVEIIWRITSRQIVDEAVLVRHLIGPDLEVRRVPLTRLPLRDPAVQISAPTWVGDAVTASRKAFEDDMAERRIEEERKFQTVLSERIKREERAFAARRDRIERRLMSEQQWFLDRLGTQLTAAEERVMPAREGLMQKLRNELAELDEERAATLERVSSAELQIHSEVLAVGLVVGGSSAGVRP